MAKMVYVMLWSWRAGNVEPTFKMHVYRFLLGFSKGSSVPPICQGAQKTQYTLFFEENGLLGAENERQTWYSLVLK